MVLVGGVFTTALHSTFTIIGRGNAGGVDGGDGDVQVAGIGSRDHRWRVLLAGGGAVGERGAGTRVRAGTSGASGRGVGGVRSCARSGKGVFKHGNFVFVEGVREGGVDNV